MKRTWTFVSPPTKRTTKRKSEFFFHQQNIENHMKKSVLKLAVGIAVFTATSAITQAQTTATPPAAPAPPANDGGERGTKTTGVGCGGGGGVRFRNDYKKNPPPLNGGPPRHE